MTIRKIWIKMVTTRKGVRRIPISASSLTGNILGAEFESSLERDLMLLLVFDEHVDYFQPQPVKIHYLSAEGKKRHYTPDVLVRFLADRPPLLCEVKPRKVLLEQADYFAPKFKAAEAYCAEQGWIFKVIDDEEIRTPRLRNIQFLWNFYDPTGDDLYASDPHFWEIVNACKAYGRPFQMNEILTDLYPNIEQRGVAINQWWTMVAQGTLICDLEIPIGAQTYFTLSESVQY
ncbi:MAG: TnsA endonuclease N-terminal domain-containing protein [Xylophilus ampelinus]